MNSYDKLNRIGEGAYGTVYRAIDKQTNSIVALKKVRDNRRGRVHINKMPTTDVKSNTQSTCFEVNMRLSVSPPQEGSIQCQLPPQGKGWHELPSRARLKMSRRDRSKLSTIR